MRVESNMLRRCKADTESGVKTMMTARYQVVDADGRMGTKPYYTPYHAEQMARALNMNEGTQYKMYYGKDRFTVEPIS
jgi:hypothetical protein